MQCKIQGECNALPFFIALDSRCKKYTRGQRTYGKHQLTKPLYYKALEAIFKKICFSLLMEGEVTKLKQNNFCLFGFKPRNLNPPNS